MAIGRQRTICAADLLRRRGELDYPEGAVFSISDDVMACDLDQTVAILNQTTGTYYTLDEVGKFIWHKLAEPITIGGLTEAVIDAYDCDPDMAANDILTLIEDLRNAKLIELSFAACG